MVALIYYLLQGIIELSFYFCLGYTGFPLDLRCVDLKSKVHARNQNTEQSMGHATTWETQL